MSNPVESSSHNCIVCGMYTMSDDHMCDDCALMEYIDEQEAKVADEQASWEMREDDYYFNDPYEGFLTEYPW